jgi:hypothetical protein
MPNVSSPSARPAERVGLFRRRDVPKGYAAALVFLIALPPLWLRFGHWFYLSLDEGIYLEGARRVAAGQVPYRDFFNITGPGTFWLYGLVFSFFGTSLAAARAVLCVELAALCALVCWLTSRFAGVAFSVGSSLLFLAMLVTSMYPVYVTHRWDSNVLAFAALACVAAADGSAGWGNRWLVAAGLLAGGAAWMTPPLLWVALALGIWIGWGTVSGLSRYLTGIAIPSVAACAALLYAGALGDMVQSLLWDGANYTAANRLPYGALAGGFDSFRRQGTPLAAAIHFADSLLPALLPPFAALAALLAMAFHSKSAQREPGGKRQVWLVSGAALGAFAACLPRVGAAQLLFASAFFWTVCWCAAGSLLPRRAQPWLGKGLGVALGLVALGAGAVGWPRNVLRKIETPAGTLSVSRLHFLTLNELRATIVPGESVFVYPYLPALYFALGVNNPTRYSWLQPGMMGLRDERKAIDELTAQPPRWVIWHDFSDALILKNWPSSDRTRLRFPEMETFLRANYHVVNPDGVVATGYRLLERNH